MVNRHLYLILYSLLFVCCSRYCCCHVYMICVWARKNNHEIACWIIIAFVHVTVVSCQNLVTLVLLKWHVKIYFHSFPYLYICMYRKYGVAGNNFCCNDPNTKQTNEAVIVSSLVLNGSLNNNHQFMSNYDGSYCFLYSLSLYVNVNLSFLK